MRRPSKRPLMTALSACTSPLQDPVLPRINSRHSIRLPSTIPSATSVPHDLSSPDNTISGPRKTSRTLLPRRRGLLMPLLAPANDHHLARTIEVMLRPAASLLPAATQRAPLWTRRTALHAKVVYRLRRNGPMRTRCAEKLILSISKYASALFLLTNNRRIVEASTAYRQALEVGTGIADAA